MAFLRNLRIARKEWFPDFKIVFVSTFDVWLIDAQGDCWLHTEDSSFTFTHALHPPELNTKRDNSAGFQNAGFSKCVLFAGDEPVKPQCGAAASCGGLCPPLPQVLEQPFTAQPRRLQVSSSQCSIFYYWLLLLLFLDSFLKTFWLIQF